MSLFITFEGGEGCGKSVQSRALYRRLSRLAVPVLLIHEPGGTPLGEKVRYLLKHPHDAISPLTELMLFNASRSQLVADIIKPALRENRVVICDRFADSTVAYQSYGRGLDLATVEAINRIAVQGLRPDLTILLDVPPQIGLKRKKNLNSDRFDSESLAFHQKVRDGFLKLASGEPNRWLIVDATLPRKEIENIIWERVNRELD